MYVSQTKAGFVAIILASAIWGVSPLFYALLNAVDPFEILAHRTLWTVVLLAMFLGVKGKLYMLLTPFRRAKDLLVIGVSSLLVAVNWGAFIWAIQIERVVEASFGYYIMPLMAVLLGAVFLRERHALAEWFAIALAGFGVLLIALAFNAIPWLALLLSTSFAIYGLLKSSLKTHPLISVILEAFLLAPFALIILGGIHFAGWFELVDARAHAVFGAGLSISLLLIFSGFVTGVPLVLFTYGARRMSYGATGLSFYVNPTLQFMCAVFVMGEPFSWRHFVAFSFIWAALAIYSWKSLRG